VRHKNVVQFLGVCTLQEHLCIVTEFMEGGSLYEAYRQRQSRISPLVVIKIGIDVARGMDYLHRSGIIHRDLKASNLLMDEYGVVKVRRQIQTRVGYVKLSSSPASVPPSGCFGARIRGVLGAGSSPAISCTCAGRASTHRWRILGCPGCRTTRGS
jgi:serine/threonine protein kinase